MVRKAASQERGWRDAKTSLVASERGERGGGKGESGREREPWKKHRAAL